MSPSLSFFDLSTEIRDNVYSYVFPVGEHIHAIPIYEPFEYWIFYICAAGNVHNRSSICSVVRLEKQFLDFSLLCAQGRVRRECLQFVLSRNNVMLHQFDVENFFETFSLYVYRLRSLSLCLKLESHDGVDWGYETATTVVDRACNLKSLALYVERVGSVSFDLGLWDKHSKFFRKLQRLPLRSARVFVNENSPDADWFSKSATEFLMRDPETVEVVAQSPFAQRYLEKRIDREKQELYASRGVVVVGPRTVKCA